jgi:hypothetical protein
MILQPTLSDIRRILPPNLVLLILKPGDKNPIDKGWPTITFEATQTIDYQYRLEYATNIGVLLGAPSQNLCALDPDTDPFLADVLFRNPEFADWFRTRGAKGGQIYFHCDGPRPTKKGIIKVPKDSPLAVGAKVGKDGKIKIDKDGLVQIGELRVEGCQSVLIGIHPDTKKHYSWPCDNPPGKLNDLDKINWHPDVVLSWKNGDAPHEEGSHKEGSHEEGSQEEGSAQERETSALSKATRIITIDYLWNYFKLPDRKGKTNNLKSPFNKDDKIGSFSIYWKDGKQYFNEHGDGGVDENDKKIQGDSFDFYKRFTKLETPEAFPPFIQLAGLAPQIETGERSSPEETEGEFLEKATRKAREWYGRKTIDVPKPIAEEAFIGFPGRWVRAIEKQTECNSDNLLAQLMVALGTMFGRYFYNYCVQNLFTNEFLTVLGDSGIARKGSALEKVKEFLKLIDPGWAKRGIKGGFPSGEAIIHFLRDPTPGRDRQGKETIRDPGNPDKRLLMVAPEFARLLKFAERKGNTLTEILREAWDSPEELSNQAKNGSDCASYPHLGLISHVTEKELRKFDPELISNGFLNRMIFVLAFQAREIPNPKPIEWPPELLEEFKEIYRLAHIPAELDISQLGAAPEPQIKHIPLAEEAESLWEKIYYEHSNNKDEKLNEILRRFNDHIRVLALIYALCDRSPVINIPHLLAAKAIMDHSRACAISIFSTFSSNKAANKILEALKRQFPAALTKTEIYNEVFNRHLPTSEIDEALAFLFQNNLATVKVCAPTPSIKKPTQKWFAIE